MINLKAGNMSFDFCPQYLEQSRYCPLISAFVLDFKLNLEVNLKKTEPGYSISRSIYVCWCAQTLSCVWFFAILWTPARQALLSMGLSRQEYWSQLPFPPGDLPHPGIKPVSLTLGWQAESLVLVPPGKPILHTHTHTHTHTQTYLYLKKSFLENPIGRGAWRATVHGVARVRHDLVAKPPPSTYKIYFIHESRLSVNT